MDKIVKIISEKKKELTGEWISMNSSYDKYISDILNFNDETVRYWDSSFDGIKMEYKKGKSIWLDLVRYSEMLLKINKDSALETLTLFFVPDKNKKFIEKILIVKTSKIIEFLKLDQKTALSLLELNEKMPRSLNAQASVTLKDMQSISEYVI